MTISCFKILRWKSRRPASVTDSTASLDAPPPYIEAMEKNSPFNRESEFKPKKQFSVQQQLKRYLIEIIAFTFDADFEKLNAALPKELVAIDQDFDHSKTILTNSENQDLVMLALTVGLASWDTENIRAEDKDLIFHHIIKPANEIEYCLGQYAAELIMLEATHRSCPERRHYTPLGRTEANLAMHKGKRRSMAYVLAVDPARIILGGYYMAVRSITSQVGYQHVRAELQGAFWKVVRHRMGSKYIRIGADFGPVDHRMKWLVSELVDEYEGK